MRVSLRVALTTMLLTALTVLPSAAYADTGMLPNGGVLQFYQLFLFEVANSATDNGTVAQQPLKLPDSLWTYFNYAHCECASPKYIGTNTSGLDVTDPGHAETKFGYKILLTPGATPDHLPAEIWTGANCDDQTTPATRGSNCTEETYDSIADVSAIYAAGGTTPFVNIFDLLTPEPALHATGECQQRTLAGDEWIAAASSSMGVLDFWQSQEIDGDTLPPPVPTVFRASSGESAVNLSWDMPDGDISDIYYYQALCIDESGNPAGDPVAAPLFQTPKSLCGAPLTIAFAGAVPSITNDAGMIDDALLEVDAGSGGSAAIRLAGSDAGLPIDAAIPDGAMDGGIPVGIDGGGVVVPQPIQDLDKGYICGSTSVATASSMRIEGLKNGTKYHVALLAIDKSGNPAGVYLQATFTPQAVTDFWEDLHDKGSHVEGGFCLINETYGDDSGIAHQLRAFRDDTLASTAFGRWLTDVYYEYGAPLGERTRDSLALRIYTGVQLVPVIAFAIAWHYLTLPGLFAAFGLLLLWRNRRRVLARRALRTAAVAATAAVALLAAPGRAHADAPVPTGGTNPDWQTEGGSAEAPSDPDWQEQSGKERPEPAKDPVTDNPAAIAPAGIDAAFDTESVVEPARVKWHAGIKVGPYTPQIDAQLGGSKPGPYEQMFGGYSILPVLDVDRVVYHGLGGLFTAGISVGYLGKTANAYSEMCSGTPVVCTPTTGTNRPRAGDTNSFRLIPISFEAGYRYTQLDDDWGIPIVPYARGGLAYDVWWVNAPSGSFATVCSDGKSTDMEPGCSTNRAAGASLGLLMAVGIAIHAEKIDANAAATMRDSGLQHAGFYLELQAAKVDGFGSDTKLAVGDSTFFGGVDFDF